MSLRIGVCGAGTVAQALLAILAEREELDTSLQLVAWASRRGLDGISGESRKLLATLEQRRGAQVEASNDVQALAQRSDLDLVVELIGGVDDARQIAESVLRRGGILVTANKALFAQCGLELTDIAHDCGGSIHIEAAVAGGIPIVRTLAEQISGSDTTSLIGILNGTCNYMVSRMERGDDYNDALKEAQQKGFAEADPALDVGGVDAAQKIAILSAIAFRTPLDFQQVTVEGIERLARVDFEMVEVFGYRIRHLARALRNPDGTVSCGAHSTLVPAENLLASVFDETNAISTQGEHLSSLTLIGPGAGGSATASSVLADIMVASRGHGQRSPLPVSRLATTPGKNLDDYHEARYLRTRLRDIPGALARFTQMIATHGVNIDRYVQRQESPGVALGFFMLSACTSGQIEAICRDASESGMTAEEPLSLRVLNGTN